MLKMKNLILLNLKRSFLKQALRIRIETEYLSSIGEKKVKIKFLVPNTGESETIKRISFGLPKTICLKLGFMCN